MSYDIWLEADLGGESPVNIGTLDWNYTSNCSPMWREAMPETDGLSGMVGMEAGEALKTLREGIKRMEAEPAKYREMDPPNGWGSFDSQLRALKELEAAFAAAPLAKVVIWQ